MTSAHHYYGSSEEFDDYWPNSRSSYNYHYYRYVPSSPQWNSMNQIWPYYYYNFPQPMPMPHMHSMPSQMPFPIPPVSMSSPMPQMPSMPAPAVPMPSPPALQPRQLLNLLARQFSLL